MTGTSKSNPLPQVEGDKVLADQFAVFFNEKIAKIREEQKDFNRYEVSAEHETSGELITKWNSVSPQYIANVIKAMPTKQCDLDILPTKLIKEDAELYHDDLDELSLTEFIAELITRSFKEGEFPNDWKCAAVKPLIKNAKLGRDFKNYRPVSNLQFISKIAERAVLNQFTNHCDTNYLFPEYQSAYRKHHSCETALVSLVDNILWSFEEGNCVDLIALDLSAAFDTVDRSILCEVLQMIFGIRDIALEWIQSYLGPRGFKVQIHQSDSEFTTLESGVAQGSCLGPVLYSCYAATLQYLIPKEISIYGFADDHALEKNFKPNINEFQTVSLLENTVQEVDCWMKENRLKMNSSKTEFITFGSRQQLAKSECELINICGEIIPRSDCIKYLGANLDRHLSMTEFVKVKCCKAMTNLKRIQRIRKFLSEETCHQLILSLVITHLDYANAILYGVSEANINRLQRIQNLAAKTVCNKKRMDSATDCMVHLHWLPIKARIEFKLLLLVFNSINGLAPVYLKNKLKIKEENKNFMLRSNKDTNALFTPRVRRQTFAARSFSYAGPHLWNSLPLNIRLSLDAEDFKKNLKTHLFKKFYAHVL